MEKDEPEEEEVPNCTVDSSPPLIVDSPPNEGVPIYQEALSRFLWIVHFRAIWFASNCQDADAVKSCNEHSRWLEVRENEYPLEALLDVVMVNSHVHSPAYGLANKLRGTSLPYIPYIHVLDPVQAALLHAPGVLSPPSIPRPIESD